MKKINLLLIFCLLILHLAHAQIPPQGFNYSAVARNSAGQPIAISTIGIQISIVKNSALGTIVYSENHFVNTDAFGLFNLVVGGGAVQSGSMTNINWSNDNYYIKLGMDASGSTNFLNMGTTQLMSVPYALHAKTAETIVGGGAGAGCFTHYIGEQFGGGVIFHLWKDVQGVEHGVIVDLQDLSSSQAWSNMDQALIGPSSGSRWDGLNNSNAIVAQAGHTSSAATLCLNSTNGGESDWYLPSMQELNMLWNNYYTVARALTQISGAAELANASYWSSTEGNTNLSWIFNFTNGNSTYNNKTNTFYVRAIRTF